MISMDIGTIFKDKNEYECYQYGYHLNSDELKLECLKHIDSENYLAVIIASMKNDSNKIPFLEKILSEKYKYIIVKSFQIDKLKMQYLSYFSSEEYIFKIILSFSSDNNKEKYLFSITSLFYRTKIIASFQEDQLKKKYLTSLNKNNMVKIIVSFKEDSDKISYLAMVSEDAYIQEILCSLKNDNLKLKYLNLILEEEYRILVIASMNNLDLMIQGLDMILDYSIKISIVDYIKEEIKIGLIMKVPGKFQLDLICSLKSNDVKLQFLESISSSQDKLLILFSMADTIKEEYIGHLNTYEENMALIYSLHNSGLRDYYRMKYEKLFNFNLGLDSKLIFGLEIELEGINSSYFNSYNYDEQHFRGTIDGTLIQGVEIKTPKLTNRSIDIRELYYICNMLYHSGLQTSLRTGGHIHFDESYFDCKEDYFALFEIWSYTEEILYLICNPEEEIPRSDIFSFAKPFVQSIKDFKNSYLKDENFMDNLHLWQEDKHNGLNLTHIGNGTHTIEFRIANGILSFTDWVLNIKLFGRLMMASKKIGKYYKKDIKSRDNSFYWNLKESLKQNIENEQKLEILLELLFSVKEKDIYRKRYYINKKLIEKEDNPILKKMKFEGWDYQRIKKHI